MKILEKDKAIELRRDGKTYSEILQEISVSKGSLNRWLREICGARESQFRIRLQIHSIDSLEEAKRYWSAVTSVPLHQFTRAYTKTTPTSKKKSGNIAPYGICSIRISDINLITKIKGWIQGLGAPSSSLV